MRYAINSNSPFFFEVSKTEMVDVGICADLEDVTLTDTSTDGTSVLARIYAIASGAGLKVEV